jgi:hypothetical protein
MSGAFGTRPLSSLRGPVERLLLLLPDQLHGVYPEAAGLSPATDAVVRRLKELEVENRRLKSLVADLSLDKQVLQEVLAKKV